MSGHYKENSLQIAVCFFVLMYEFMLCLVFICSADIHGRGLQAAQYFGDDPYSGEYHT